MARGTDADSALLAAIEAVEAAGAALQEVVVGRGLLDPTLAAIVTAFAQHHHEHAAAYQAARGSDEPAAADADVVELLGPGVLGAVDATSLAVASLAVEDALASSTVDLAGRLRDRELVALAASIAPVEAQHAAVLAVALGLAIEVVSPEVVLADSTVLGG